MEVKHGSLEGDICKTPGKKEKNCILRNLNEFTWRNKKIKVLESILVLLILDACCDVMDKSLKWEIEEQSLNST